MRGANDLRQQPLADRAPPRRDRAKARPRAARARDPQHARGHRLFGAPRQSSKEGMKAPVWTTQRGRSALVAVRLIIEAIERDGHRVPQGAFCSPGPDDPEAKGPPSTPNRPTPMSECPRERFEMSPHR